MVYYIPIYSLKKLQFGKIFHYTRYWNFQGIISYDSYGTSLLSEFLNKKLTLM